MWDSPIDFFHWLSHFFPPPHSATHPVLVESGSFLQTLLQLWTQPARPAKIMHHPAGVAQLLGGQQGLQRPQVALQGLGQRRNRLWGHGRKETQLLPQGNLQVEGEEVKQSSSYENAERAVSACEQSGGTSSEVWPNARECRAFRKKESKIW